jgi:hypothetical protein
MLGTTVSEEYIVFIFMLEDWRQNIIPKRLYPSAKMHDVTSEEKEMFKRIYASQ